MKGINLGKKNGMWKGNDIDIAAIHYRMKKRKPKPELCKCCGKEPPYDLANISGEYKLDVNDFEWLCRKCHMIKDGRATISPMEGHTYGGDGGIPCKKCGEIHKHGSKGKKYLENKKCICKFCYKPFLGKNKAKTICLECRKPHLCICDMCKKSDNPAIVLTPGYKYAKNHNHNQGKWININKGGR